MKWTHRSMWNSSSTLGCLLLVSTLGGCGEMPQDDVEVSLFAVGASERDVEVSEELSLSLDQAEVAFGPLYLCPGVQAGELCDSARLEWTDSAVIDGLDDQKQPIGLLSGVTGTVRSWMFDYGLTSLLTRDDPLISAAARELGGVSFLARGNARVADIEVPFSVEVAVFQGEDAEKGVQVVRKASSESFDHDVTGNEEGLLVRFDPREWFVDLEPADFIQDEVCSSGRQQVCAGTVQHSCDGEGNSLEAIDCAEAGQVCVPNQGCADAVAFGPESSVARRIGIAMVTGARPQLQWQ